MHCEGMTTIFATATMMISVRTAYSYYDSYYVNANRGILLASDGAFSTLSEKGQKLNIETIDLLKDEVKCLRDKTSDLSRDITAVIIIPNALSPSNCQSNFQSL